MNSFFHNNPNAAIRKHLRLAGAPEASVEEMPDYKQRLNDRDIKNIRELHTDIAQSQNDNEVFDLSDQLEIGEQRLMYRNYTTETTSFLKKVGQAAVGIFTSQPK